MERLIHRFRFALHPALMLVASSAIVPFEAVGQEQGFKVQALLDAPNLTAQDAVN